jgi:hypothetical protein
MMRGRKPPAARALGGNVTLIVERGKNIYVKNTNATVMNTVAKRQGLKSGTSVEPQAPPSLKVKSNI